jgi:hypothetical protein
MIEELEIVNFKSIKNLRLRCKRVNLLIGEPNTGKSNILEALGLLSFCAFPTDFQKFVRFEDMSHLFYQRSLDKPVEISWDGKKVIVEFRDGRFDCHFWPDSSSSPVYVFRATQKGEVSCPFPANALSYIKFYRFQPMSVFEEKRFDFLLPPDGRNLLNVLLTNRGLWTIVSQIFVPFGLELLLEPHEDRIKVQMKPEAGLAIAFPYSMASETLQRLVFHLVAIESNKESTVVFEEPEVHTFPYYAKFLAERIALSENQYFVSTHNPYILIPLLEKCKKEEVAVFLVYYDDYQTKVKSLTSSEIEEILSARTDPFLDIERFLEKK